MVRRDIFFVQCNDKGYRLEYAIPTYIDEINEEAYKKFLNPKVIEEKKESGLRTCRRSEFQRDFTKRVKNVDRKRKKRS